MRTPHGNQASGRAVHLLPLESINPTPRILILDSDVETVSRWSDHLKRDGFRPSTGQGGPALVDNLRLLRPALVLLGRRLPQGDCFELLARIRMNKETADLPIIFICDQEDETDQVVAFRLGANDVVTKTVSLRILSARIRLQLRLGRPDPAFPLRFPERFLQVGDLLLDFWGHQAILAGAPLPLTPSEFLLLALLAQNHGNSVSRKEMAAALGKPEETGPLRRIDSHIKALRQKLGNCQLVQTVQRKGYRINPEISCDTTTH